MKPMSFLSSKEAAISEAERVLKISGGRKNITIGSLIPYNTDKDIVIAVSDYLKDK